ncbi:MAG: LysE family translocator [Pseudomonadota bacterium]
MTYEIFAALVAFAFVSVITPGPNNLMLMASGANFGFRKTVPHMLGIGIGFPTMVVLVGLGVMQVFDLWPPSYTVLKFLSVCYLLYLAWKIANAAPPSEAATQGTALSFLQSAGFQWLNPKAWSMALSAITLYAASRDIQTILLIAGIYVLVSVISTTSYTALGQQMRRLINNPTRLRRFNIAMAGLLVLSLVPVLLPTG